MITTGVERNDLSNAANPSTVEPIADAASDIGAVNASTEILGDGQRRRFSIIA
jgi:hypothetical protein